jgi:hypothetical protein
VKKTVAILLLSTYLLGMAGFSELLKIDVVIEHFHETKQANETLSFFDFLVMHYITDDSNNQDNDRDSQMPFKSATNITAYSLNAILQKTEVHLQHPFAKNQRQFVFPNMSFASADFSSSIWQPPKNS